ncbi:alkaline phosphatase D family protein [Pelagicoccus mobilis]|uniref:Alkaline phosphatase D family protein n=1 Tax=Pelagicoccus mobilis TaxID=415221 RepID=A0A934S4N9_9BACT|nr:alkaline phosphatase D family protein [Pelagicoccus mobilis]MBK1879717.1 alkaline phosphatase D family protein [Pelagicoccus mobilis]
MPRLRLLLMALGFALCSLGVAEIKAEVFLANGIKIGEVDSNSAIVWTRLTQFSDRNLKGLSWGDNESLPAGKSLEEMEYSVPGARGDVKVDWWLEGVRVGGSGWGAVDPQKDFTSQIKLSDLLPDQEYRVAVYSRTPDGAPGQTIKGRFRTAPSENEAEPVRFTVVSCQEFSRRDDKPNGHTIYSTMLDVDPDFFVHTGDIVYYDYKRSNPKARNSELARYKWNRMYSLPYQKAFHNQVSSYFIKDDHDTVKNDSTPGDRYGDLTWDQGLWIFREQVPMGKETYRTVRWGKDLQIWLVEGRDFRSPNDAPDGPEKTIWGEEQKQWFFESVKKSDATFRILISPTPVVGPDRGNKFDNHANVNFSHEGNEIRTFISKQRNMFVICGDRHWQYVSQDTETGVREYACGSASDQHAGGYSEDRRTPMHEYLKVRGGFLSVQIKRENGRAQAVLTHHGVDGQVLNRDVLEAETVED